MEANLFYNSAQEFIESQFEILFKKKEEYATDGNVFENFENAVGISFHDTPEGVLWEYMVKHLQSIKDMIKDLEIGGEVGGHYDEKLVNEKIGDAINYLLLLRGMLINRI